MIIEQVSACFIDQTVSPARRTYSIALMFDGRHLHLKPLPCLEVGISLTMFQAKLALDIGSFFF